MGLFMALVTTCIGFYYAVISGWCWIYFIRVVFNPLPTTKEQSYEWFDSMQGVWSEVAAIAMIIVSCLICYKGVKALERVNIVLVPTLLVIVLGTLIWAMTLPGAMEGVKFLFTPDWKQFLNPTGWVNALSQISWDTSAAYGAFLTYAIYMQHVRSSARSFPGLN
jgi:NSS family neurotransmitter:Na+ symporter